MCFCACSVAFCAVSGRDAGRRVCGTMRRLLWIPPFGELWPVLIDGGGGDDGGEAVVRWWCGGGGGVVVV